MAWRYVSKECRHFITKLLVVNPDDRLSAAEALKHPWLNKQKDSYAKQFKISKRVLQQVRNYRFMCEFKHMAMRVASESVTNKQRKFITKTF